MESPGSPGKRLSSIFFGKSQICQINIFDQNGLARVPGCRSLPVPPLRGYILIQINFIDIHFSNTFWDLYVYNHFGRVSPYFLIKFSKSFPISFKDTILLQCAFDEPLKPFIQDKHCFFTQAMRGPLIGLIEERKRLDVVESKNRFFCAPTLREFVIQILRIYASPNPPDKFLTETGPSPVKNSPVKRGHYHFS